jgi:hypothetical protein
MRKNKLVELIGDQFVKVMVKVPAMVVGGRITDVDDIFIYLTQEPESGIVMVVPISNLSAITLEDEVAFLMSGIDNSDHGEKQ